MKLKNLRYLHTSFVSVEKERIVAAMAAQGIPFHITEERSERGGPPCFKMYVPVHDVPRALGIIQEAAPATPSAKTAPRTVSVKGTAKTAAPFRRRPSLIVCGVLFALGIIAAALSFYSGLIAPFEHADANAMAAHGTMLAGVVVLVSLYVFAERLRP